ncbi:MAG: Zn-dependent protease [Thermoproteota archaeon]|jgi:Zn-dependent protease
MKSASEIIYTIAMAMPGLVSAIVIHESAHAWMANRYGDTTAKDAGRISLNPAVHYDLYGTIVFPLVMICFGWGAFGWAKPVPVNPRNFSNLKKGVFWVSFAGPLSNLCLGILLALTMGIFVNSVGPNFSFLKVGYRMLDYAIMINFLLAFFNLLPIPPLDGSRMLAVFLNPQQARVYESFAQHANKIFLGLFIASMMGIPILGYLLKPAFMISSFFKNGFLMMFH